MAGPKPLTVKLDTIPPGGLQLQLDTTQPAFQQILSEVATGKGSDQAGTAQFSIELWPNRVDVKGQVAASLELTCVRCLNPYTESIDHPIVHILLRHPEDHDSEEVELSRADLDRSELTGDTIELGEILREELELALPMKPLCNADCKGICAGCGAELNHEECSCEPSVDPRWDALKGLKLGEA
ncbi:MAG: DUF177 domain-containing protein [Myxococcota bacterium]|nr:DUF177 domain-containing protein [Myxococcota bacterium]